MEGATPRQEGKSANLELIRRYFPAVLGVGLFVVALWLLHRQLAGHALEDILRELRALPAEHIALAIVTTAASYLVMTLYDHLAISHLEHSLPRRNVSFASFVSYAFSNNIGLSLLTSSSIRYRLYSAWGLSVEEISRLVIFTTSAFWLGIFAMGGSLFLIEPLALPGLSYLPILSARPLGVAFVLIVAAYILWIIRKPQPLLLKGWRIPFPTLPQTLLQLLIGSLDWLLAGSVLFLLFPAGSGISFWHLLGIYLFAQTVALISHVPGGLGVFESMVIISSPDLSTPVVAGVLLLYRGIYYLLPLAIASILLGCHELMRKRKSLESAAQIAVRWIGGIVPSFFALTTLVIGAVLLFSGAMPAQPGRLAWLREFFPLSVLELSHFLGSLTGAAFLLLARGLQRRLDAAWLATILLLIAGIFLSLIKGLDYEESLLILVLLLSLLPSRRYFYRKTSLLAETFSPGWISAIAVVICASLWLGLFSFKHIEYSHELWWQFAFHADAPRFLRATVGIFILFFLFGLARLLGPARIEPLHPDQATLKSAAEIVAMSPATEANLALLGDKSLLFNDRKNAFVMYAVEGRSWVAMGDPVGPVDEASELAWDFREMAERNGGWPVFYEVGLRSLHNYLDMGLTLLKIGEEARVDLSGFSLEGPHRSGLRYVHRRMQKEGCNFSIVPAEGVTPLLPQLRHISDAWLIEKHTREKGFSLGFFDENYLQRFPLAVVHQDGQLVAFANLWPGAELKELSIDLMRYLPGVAPRGVMDYMFTSLMLWGKAEGYASFVLGMAPLSGLENRPLAPLWSRIGAVIFRHGEHFYNFQGLREYKAKYDPVWEPRYLASPGGLTVPLILTNIATLISGDLKGVLGK